MEVKREYEVVTFDWYGTLVDWETGIHEFQKISS